MLLYDRDVASYRAQNDRREELFRELLAEVVPGHGLLDLLALSVTTGVRRAQVTCAPRHYALRLVNALRFGRLGGQDVVFLPRHGRGHRIPPTDINVRANIDALKRAGCTQILSLTAVGSLREELPPGTLVVVDQFIDRTFARPKTFF